MAGGVEVGDGAHGQQRHRVVEAVQRVAGRVEEEDVTQAQHQAGHRHRQHGQQAHQAAQQAVGGQAAQQAVDGQAAARRAGAAGFFQQVSADEDHHGAEHRRAGGHHQAVGKGRANFAIDQPHRVVSQRGAQVVRPELGERREHRHAHHRQHQRGDHPAVRRGQAVAPGLGLGPVGHGAGGQQGGLSGGHQPVDGEGQHRRRQQQQRHHRAALKVLLADHQLEHVGGQHVEVAADHLGDAEVGHHQREADQRSRYQPVSGAWQRDGEKAAQRAGAHRVGGLVEPAIGRVECGDQDHQRMRQHREALGQHDAWRAVDLRDAQRLHGAFQHALVAEPVDQRDRRQQRRRQQGQQRDAAKQRLEAHAAAPQRVGEAEGQRHHDHRDQRRHPQAVEQRVQQGRRAGVGDEVGDADKSARGVFDRLHQDGGQWRGQKNQQRQQHHRQAGLRETQRGVDLLAQVGLDRHAHAHAHAHDGGVTGRSAAARAAA